METSQSSESNPSNTTSHVQDTESKSQSQSADAAPLLNTRSVETEVTSYTSPVVTHEIVQQRVHEIFEEKITREIHKHHIYHRTLPVLDTEVLPSRHFAESSDVNANGKGLVEISEREVRKMTGLPVREWVLVPRSSLKEFQNNGGRRPPHNSQNRLLGVEFQTEPILVDKKTYVTEDGIPRTEYLWRHPPVFVDVHGRTSPVRIPAGISDDWRQIVMNAKRDGATTEPSERSHGAHDAANDVRRDDVVDGGTSAKNTASRQVVPPTAMGNSEHGGLAIRTVPRGDNMAQNYGGKPDLARKGSLQNLKGAEKEKGALTTPKSSQSGEDSAQLRRTTEVEARQMFLNNGSSTNTGAGVVP